MAARKHLDDLWQVDQEGAGVPVREPDVGVPVALPLALALAHVPQVRHQLQRLQGRALPSLQVTRISDRQERHARCFWSTTSLTGIWLAIYA